jgi:hypothetical protein
VPEFLLDDPPEPLRLPAPHTRQTRLHHSLLVTRWRRSSASSSSRRSPLASGIAPLLPVFSAFPSGPCATKSTGTPVRVSPCPSHKPRPCVAAARRRHRADQHPTTDRPLTNRIAVRLSTSHSMRFKLLAKGIAMNGMTPERPSNEAAAATSSIQGDHDHRVRGDVVTIRKPRAETGTELDTDGISPLIQEVASASVGEIDKLIADLQAARDYLESEGERIQHEATRYAQLGQRASASVKVIAESLSQWRNANGSSAVESASGVRQQREASL